MNAIGESSYWDSTVVFMFWDDDGGWYDHVAPRMVDYDGLGARVPLLVISRIRKTRIRTRTFDTSTAAS